jgi:asparagine synthase (glutamine-hydrolysing)
MCGIVGAFALESNGFAVTRPYLERLRDAMVHRGPDGHGLWIADDGRIGLAFRRLKIVDLSDRASQPMSNEDGSLRLVYNGEIYNHVELRHELEAAGQHRWLTDHSDTEVILHAFEEWGIDCLHRLRGMFAFALWDARSKELWLVRDRIGVKPLYYSVHDRRLVFASEIKALLQDPQQERRVDEEAFYHYLSFLTTPAPRTLFAGINKLKPATWLRIGGDGTMREHRYWDVWDHVEPLEDASEDEIAEQLLGELRTSVRLRKVSDVPVGVFLSGGIDSSTNAALFSEGEIDAVKTFSVGYEGNHESYRNEFDYARLMARHVAADHHERVLTLDDLIDFLPRMIQLQDEPIADPVCVPVYYVSKLARENGVIVCQVGEGADELFWGYPSWKTLLRLQRYDELPVPKLVKEAAAGGYRLLGKEDRREYELLRRACSGLPIFWGGAEAFSESAKRRLLSPRLRRELDGLSSWQVVEPIRQRFDEAAWEPSHLNWMTYVDLNIRLPELLLMRIDKMSMGVSLEGRVPYLDHKFVEFAMSIPERVKTNNGNLKHILKKAVRGVVPDELIDRPKQGFAVPVREWFSDVLGERARTELDDFCRKTDFLDHDQVARLIDAHREREVWYLLNFALWWKEYIA